MMHLIINGKVLLEDHMIGCGFILFDTKIKAYGAMDDLEDMLLTVGISINACEVLDATGAYVSPGWIDIHLHGTMGFDVMDSSLDALSQIARAVRINGVTSFLPTTMTLPESEIQDALDRIAHKMQLGVGEREAEIIGAHLEGPFINREKKGAQNEKYVQVPNFKWIQSNEATIRMITLAPECDQDFNFTKQMQAFHHIALALGHTNCSYDCALNAFKLGITHITHCFNAMPPLHHREPGVIGAMMQLPFTTDLIADDVHVHPGLYKGLYEILNGERLTLISDCTRAGGLAEGDYDLGGQSISTVGGVCRLPDGTLAGSTLTLNRALERFNEAYPRPMFELVKLVSLNPAKVIKISDVKGSIKVGKDADLTLFVEGFKVIQTFVKGSV